MTMLRLPEDVLLCIPTAWDRWTWAGLDMRRESDGVIWAKWGGKWRRVNPASVTERKSEAISL